MRAFLSAYLVKENIGSRALAFVFVAPLAAVLAPIFIIGLLAIYVWTGTAPNELAAVKADPEADSIRAALKGATIH